MSMVMNSIKHSLWLIISPKELMSINCTASHGNFGAWCRYACKIVHWRTTWSHKDLSIDNEICFSIFFKLQHAWLARISILCAGALENGVVLLNMYRVYVHSHALLVIEHIKDLWTLDKVRPYDEVFNTKCGHEIGFRVTQISTSYSVTHYRTIICCYKIKESKTFYTVLNIIFICVLNCVQVIVI